MRFLTAFLLFTSQAHAFSTCVGEGQITHRFASRPTSETRKFFVSFSPSTEFCEQMLLRGPAEAMVTLEMGADPIVYEGPIHLDGKRPNLIRFANDDVFRMWLRPQGKTQLWFELRSGEDETYPPPISVPRVLLDCE